MIALEKNELTEGMAAIGRQIISRFGRPKAILVISAHWYGYGSRIQTARPPRQIYDMYGWPAELYEVRYPVNGDDRLTERVRELLGDQVVVDNGWGLDHGSWAVLVHMFPKADIPVVQLSVAAGLAEEEIFALGKALAPLRDEGFLILGSGNAVHNLRRVEWENEGGTPMAEEFDDYIVNAILAHEDEKVIHYQNGPHAAYAVPTEEHYLPLLYALGAADGDSATVFNRRCILGSIGMTGFLFGA